MVVFCCNVCGDSLRKNQVEKHWRTQCRRSQHVSCMDCQKDFWGNDYQAHTKCISEEEKYSAPGFVAKVNKGEVKQDLWIQQVRAAMSKSMSNPRLKDLLERLVDFPNIPRKKQKFENFLSNSMRVRDKNLCSLVWDVLMSEKVEKKEESVQEKSDSAKSGGDTTKLEEKPEQSMDAEDVAQKKLSKRERKEERKKKQNKVEKKEKRAEMLESQAEADDGAHLTKKRKKKRKRDEEGESEGLFVTENGHKKKKCEMNEVEDDAENARKKKKKKKNRDVTEENGVSSEDGRWNSKVDLEEVTSNGTVEKAKKKKKKKSSDENDKSREETDEAMETSAVTETEAGDGEDDDGEDDPKPAKSKHHSKIRVDSLIVEILQSKGELPVKKLKKKVLQELTAQGALSKSREALWAKVEKKLQKNPRYRLHKDRVKLLD